MEKDRSSCLLSSLLPLSWVLFCLPACRAFNLDTERPSVFTGPSGSYFGYSVEFYSPTDTRTNVLIGAPRANVSSDWLVSSSLVQRGAVYGCPWRRDSSCKQIAFDNTDERRSDGGVQMEFKSDQWFGATVRSNGHHILACAPMYQWTTLSQSDREPVGSCFIKTPTSTVEYAPCRTASNSPEGQGFCQAGFTGDFVKNSRVVLGAPGSYYWQGQLISDDISEIVAGSNKQFVTSYSSQRSTKPASAQYDDSYLGYAVAIGDFNGDGEEDYVTGVPRGDKSLGYVTILNGLNMEAMVNLTGWQMASYYGHSVAATDINNDGFVDVLVGAPLFMEPRSDGKQREVGQVCVYLGGGNFSFLRPQRLSGWEAYARYSSAIVSLGDLDMDGFNDVAISAPYGGPDRRGMVYIYNGHPTGLKPTASQVLEGKWASSYMAPSFGYSLRGNTDIDDNGYPDLLVGAFGADRAILYRSRPVIVMNVSLALQPQIIDPEEKNCRLETGANVSCFTVKYCLKATGRRVPSLLTVMLELVLDAGRQQGQQRALFLHSQSTVYRKNMTLTIRDRPACEELRAHLRGPSEFRDKMSPISVTLASALEPRSAAGMKGLSPILHQNTPANVTKQVHILLDCGVDNICTPDLHLTVHSDRQQMYFGDDNGVTLLIDIENRGEGAYEAELRVTLPPHADFTEGVRDELLSRLPCAYERVNLTRLVVCDLGNPLKKQTKLSAGLRFSVHQLSDQDTSIQFDLQIVSSNQYGGSSELVSSITRLAVLANVEIRGISAPDQVFLPIANWSPQRPPLVDDHIGPLVQHIYELRNNGPSVFTKAILDIFVPYRHGNKSLLYITSLETDGPMSCDSIPSLESFKLPGEGVTDNNSSVVASGDQSEEGRSQSEERRNQGFHNNHIHRRDLMGEAGILGCEVEGCFQVKCWVGRMERGTSAILFIRSRLDVASFLQPQAANRSFVVRSEGRFTVISFPYKLLAPLAANSTTVSTSVVWLVAGGGLSVPVWAIALAVLAGLLLLALVSYGMYKAGYFNRVRPPLSEDGIEKEQLQPQNGDITTDT